MPGSAADVVDSHSGDWHISDDGYDWGPVRTWPAPVLSPDDRSNAYKADRTLRPRSGLFDAYAFLRYEPDNPLARRTKVDAQGFASLDDAGWIHDAGRMFWSDVGALPVRSRLLPGQSMRSGDQLTSPNGAYVLILQSDGNLVLYRKGGAAIWDAATTGRGGVRLVMQTDGNLVLYNAQNGAVWDTRTQGRTGVWLNLQDDGNAVLYDRKTPVWTADTAGGVKHEHSSSLFDKIGGAVSSVGSAIGHAASDVAKVAAPLMSVVRTVAPFAQTALSFVPGVGSVVNGAIAAGASLAQGNNITDALINAAASAVPGGPLAKQAFSTALNVVKGQNVTQAALDAVRSQIPGGLPAKAAFDTAVALAHGQNLQQAAMTGARTAAPVAAAAVEPLRSQAMSYLDQLSPFASRALSSVGPAILGRARQAPSLLSPQVRNVAQAILRRPELRSVPIGELARRMSVTEHDARQGVASVVQAVAKAGGRALPGLTQAGDLADRLAAHVSFDQAIARFASRATRPIYTHNAIVARRRFLGARGMVDAGSFLDAGALPPTIQQGSTGAAVIQWQQIIGVKADGQFGPKTKAATVSWQSAHGLVADGIVGPKTWTAALGAVASPAPASVPAPSMPALPAAAAPIVAAATQASPVVVSTLASQLPMLKVGSTGPAVVKWQTIVGTKADGIFGPQTQAATKIWQAQHGLVADGIVGPKTWAAAMTPTVSSAPPPPPAPFPAPPVMTTPVTVPTPVGPIALPIPTTIAPPVLLPTPDNSTPALPPSITTFPMPPVTTPSGTPPFIPGQVSTVSTPDGPVTGVTDRTGTTVTVTQPPITGSAPSSSGSGLGVGALVVLGTLLALGSSGSKKFL